MEYLFDCSKPTNIFSISICLARGRKENDREKASDLPLNYKCVVLEKQVP